MSTRKLGPKLVINEIIKSPEDSRQYRGLQLENNMKVLLVSDGETEKAAAAVKVDVGSMSDPDDLPDPRDYPWSPFRFPHRKAISLDQIRSTDTRLAHFLEHMLFMGTEKYPDESDYSKFINDHGGSNNAYTDRDNTVYYFDVSAGFLRPALDRFAQFFLHPLFTVSAAEREVNAVNAENDKNLESDVWRLSQLHRSTLDQSHPFARFSTGNRTTLWTEPRKLGIDTHARLLDFHRQYYSANLMSLVVFGAEPLDELQDMILELFNDVVDKQVPEPFWDQHPQTPSVCGRIVKVVPVLDNHKLSVYWPMPWDRPYNKTAPLHYIGHLIGHEGPGSLMSALKRRGWAQRLYAGKGSGARGFSFCQVGITLTEEGIANVDGVCNMLFKYINLLRNSGPQEWIFNECRDLRNLAFRFKGKNEAQTVVTEAVVDLRSYEMNEVLYGPYDNSLYKTDIISDRIDRLASENVKIHLISKNFQGKTDKVEPFYKTNYSLDPIPDEQLRTWSKILPEPADDLYLPKPNEFIPQKFDIFSETKSTEPMRPVRLSHDSSCRTWFSQDSVFRLPKVYFSMALHSPPEGDPAVFYTMHHMMTELVTDALNEICYDAELAGLGYGISEDTLGLTFQVNGYHDKADVLLQHLVKELSNHQPKEDRYNVIRELYERNLKNFNSHTPYSLAITYLYDFIAEGSISVATQQATLKAIDFDRLKTFASSWLKKAFLECLVYGNSTEASAKHLVDCCQKAFGGMEMLAPAERLRYHLFKIPSGQTTVLKIPHKVHPANAVACYYQVGLENMRTKMQCELFDQVINELFFDDLRTKQTLGYVTQCMSLERRGVCGFAAWVQSDYHPEYVENAIEKFLQENVPEILNNLTESELAEHIDALAVHRLQKPKKPSQQRSKFWSEIAHLRYFFDRDEKEVAVLKTLTKADLIAFFEEHLSAESPHRRKMTVVIESSKIDKPKGSKTGLKYYDAERRVMVPEDQQAFRNALERWPLPRPRVEIEELHAMEHIYDAGDRSSSSSKL